MVTIPKYKKIKIDYARYIKVFSDGNFSYLTVYTDVVLNTNNNNETYFPELRKMFEEEFEIKFQEGYVLKYINFRISQSLIGFSIYHNYHIMEQANKWFPAGKFRKVDTPFRAEFTYRKGLVDAVTLTRNYIHKIVM